LPMSYYPPSKNPYQDPLSTASQGTTQVDADSRVDLSDAALKEAKDDVRSTSGTTWCLFGYVGTSSKLKVVASGQGEGNCLEQEMMDELHHGKPMFGFVRFLLESNTTPKFVYFTWNPAGVPPMLKGLMHGRSYDIGKFMEPYHLQVDATQEEDLDEKKILEKLRKGANK